MKLPAFYIFAFLISASIGAGHCACALQNDATIATHLPHEQQPLTPNSQEPSHEIKSELEGTVEVSFSIDAEGKVKILNINASNPKLIDYVVKRLNKIQLDKGDSAIGKIIKYRFVFKKQA